jgi:hypothetical protein
MSAPSNDDDFYVGYLRMPRRLAILVAFLVAVIFALIAVDLAVLARLQQPSGPGTWADTDRTFEGALTRAPYPILWVTENGRPSAHLLVADSKRSANTVLDAAVSGPVKITGKLVARNDVAGVNMIEMAAGAVTPAATAIVPELASQSLGEATLKGEIVDSKCWLGVMRPGQGRVHKGCATVCILGGIPPILVTRDAQGVMQGYVLMDRDGQAVAPAEIQDVIGDPVSLRGAIERKGGLLFLKADLASLKRL